MSHGNKGLWPCVGIFPSTHASGVVGVLCAPSLRYSSLYDPWPLLDTAKARSYPFWCVCVTFSLCPLLPPGSSPLFFCVVRGVVCVVLLATPLFLLPPLDGRFLVVGCVLFFSSFAWIPRIPPYIIALSFHPGYMGLMFFVTKDSSEAGLLFTAHPLFIHVEFVCFLLWLLLRLRIGEGPSPLCCFCLCSERGGRFPVEPWTRLHCSRLYWRCPVELPVVQTGAPRVQQSPAHMVRCADVL